MDRDRSLGQVAWEAYNMGLGGMGRRRWAELSEDTRVAWENSAAVVADAVLHRGVESIKRIHELDGRTNRIATLGVRLRDRVG
jgi:hypothetical protein